MAFDYVALANLYLNGTSYVQGDLIAEGDLPTEKIRSFARKGLIDVVGGDSGGGASALVASSVFTDESSVSIDDCFTAALHSYRVVIELTDASTSLTAHIRLRASGTDATSNDYKSAAITANGAYGPDRSVQSGTYLYVMGMGTTVPTAGATLDVVGPATAAMTYIHMTSSQYQSNPAHISYQISTTCQHIVATAYDGLTVTASAGTFSGRVLVYAN